MQTLTNSGLISMKIRDTLPFNTLPIIAQHIIEVVSIGFLANDLIFLNKLILITLKIGARKEILR